MRVLFLMAVLVLVASCQKHKEKKAYKKLWGSYTTESAFVVFENEDYHVEADLLGLNEVGVGLSLSTNSSEYGCEFSLLENDSPEYDYKLSFDKLRLFILNTSTGQLIEQPSPSKSELNSGRAFYLKVYDDNTLGYIVVYDSGEIETHTLKK